MKRIYRESNQKPGIVVTGDEIVDAAKELQRMKDEESKWKQVSAILRSRSGACLQCPNLQDWDHYVVLRCLGRMDGWMQLKLRCP
ncbi:uncharacterized protein G2W53_042134 [Senna tora]|uniref:Uncharacterized protein n=1 Tax=Senna tora TaxID=362788 RepID=A0A834SIL5_9FABA|nr:uncharacterized protein G2W53_042134 [Senna tora]